MTFYLNEIKVNISFWFAAVITLMLLIIPKSSVPMFFCFCILHESGHLGMMLITGQEPEEITLGSFGMRIKTGSRLISPKKDILIAAAGPFVNLVLAAVFCFADNHAMAEANLALALFNLMPVSVLDGGKILGGFTDNEKLIRIVSLAAVSVILIIGGAVAVYSRGNCMLLIIAVYLIIEIYTESLRC